MAEHQTTLTENPLNFQMRFPWVVVADTGSAALSVLPRQIIFGSRTIRGWYSGHAKDAEEALAFAAQVGIRPMIEVFPLAQVKDALERTWTGQARFRTVLLPGQ